MLQPCLLTRLVQKGSDLTPEQQAGVAALRDGLADKKHFWLLHEPTWRLLQEW
jgi:hypothetical protein